MPCQGSNHWKLEVNKRSFQLGFVLKYPSAQEKHSFVLLFQFRKEAAKAFLLLIAGDAM